MARISIFTKIVIFVFLMLIPILFMFSYSNRTSVSVVENEIENSKIGQLSFFMKQVDTTADQLAVTAIILSRDPNIRQYQDDYLNSRLLDLDKAKAKSNLLEIIGAQSLASNWSNTYTVYSPSLGEAISSSEWYMFNPDQLQSQLSLNWRYDVKKGEFVRHVVEPFAASDDIKAANTVVEVRFSVDNLVKMLNQFKEGGNGDPFLYCPGQSPIANSSVNAELMSSVISKLPQSYFQNGHHNGTFTFHGKTYLVMIQPSTKTGWFLIDYVPLQNVLLPIVKSRNAFYTTIGLMMMMSLIASIMLYRSVQRPILSLVHGVQSLKRGDFSVRIPQSISNEFTYLFDRFNEMAEQIGVLIDKVYKEELRAREAVLKQLQSQINPHFLYNCLAFVMSMAKLKEHESVIAMAHSLGKYYRYTTRLEKPHVSVGEEIDFILKYLEIQTMRTSRIRYRIDITEDVRHLQIPRLLLQPLVENAILHGLEHKLGGGTIQISGSIENDYCTLNVEDDGIGLSSEQIELLNKRMNLPLEQDTGFGLWNIHQRLQYAFGDSAGLRFEAGTLEGLKAVLRFPFREPDSNSLSQQEEQSCTSF